VDKKYFKNTSNKTIYWPAMWPNYGEPSIPSISTYTNRRTK